MPHAPTPRPVRVRQARLGLRTAGQAVLLATCAVLVSLTAACGTESDNQPLETGQCRRDSDCERSYEYCVRAGSSNSYDPCGTCMMPQHDCSTDADCGAGNICRSESGGEPCLCEPAMRCAAGCTAETVCAQGMACDPTTGRCAAAPCAADEDCPAPFVCGAGTCQRMPCAATSECRGDAVCDGHLCTDAECSADDGCNAQHGCRDGLCRRLDCASDGDCQSGGYCVHGQCFVSPGECKATAA